MSQIDLMHAECVAAMRKLADRSVDHVITDPPYSEKTHAKGKRYKCGDIVDHVIKYKPMTPAIMRAVSRQIVRITKRWIIVTCDSDSPQLWAAALVRAGAEFVRHGIFYKDDAQPQEFWQYHDSDLPGRDCEDCLVMEYPQGLQNFMAEQWPLVQKALQVVGAEFAK